MHALSVRHLSDPGSDGVQTSVSVQFCTHVSRLLAHGLLNVAAVWSSFLIIGDRKGMHFQSCSHRLFDYYHHSTKFYQKISQFCCRLYCYECAVWV